MINSQYDNERLESNTNSVRKQTKVSSIAAFGLIILIIVVVYLSRSHHFYTDGHLIDRTKSSIKVLKSAVVTFQMHTGRLPTEDEGLIALLEEPENAENWGPEGYLMTDQVPTDSWGNAFIYKLKPQSKYGFVIISLGKEGGKGFNKDLTFDD